jgi:mono/diheme cytochrome c family protein
MENMVLRATALGVTMVALAAAAGKGDPAAGKQLFQKQCAVCHYADSQKKKMAPGLKGLFRKDKMENGKKPTEANVRARIDQGGNGMPEYRNMIGEAQKDDVVAYLKTL